MRFPFLIIYVYANILIVMSEEKITFPTEEVTLPSKCLVYSAENPLARGTIEMKYMTAREEDILTNESYIKKGTVIDKLLQSLIVTPINYNDLVIGDKNALLIAARVLGYGKDYTFELNGKTHNIDLTELVDKPLKEEHLIRPNHNEFSFTLPVLKKEITFKLLTHSDEKKIEEEIKGKKKVNQEAGELTTRLKHTITSVNGESDHNKIKDFVENYLLASDAKALRDYIKEVSPGVDMTFNDGEKDIDLPITLTFFWPELG